MQSDVVSEFVLFKFGLTKPSFDGGNNGLVEKKIYFVKDRKLKINLCSSCSLNAIIIGRAGSVIQDFLLD